MELSFYSWGLLHTGLYNIAWKSVENNEVPY